METVEVLVRIPKRDFEELQSNYVWWGRHGEYIKKGTVLPKGHGRLFILDEEKAKKFFTKFSFSVQDWISEVGISNATIKVIEADRDCEHCSRTYGTLGCCSTVSNKWVYSCEEGQREYEEIHKEVQDGNS